LFIVQAVKKVATIKEDKVSALMVRRKERKRKERKRKARSLFSRYRGHHDQYLVLTSGRLLYDCIDFYKEV
jgi:hypothetical protein